MAKKGSSSNPAFDFIDDFEKDISKVEGISESSQPPKWWISFGNYVLNRIMSGGYDRGVPQGRLTGVTGPSGAGKSFIIGNVIKNAQAQGAMVLVVDSENALDDEYMESIGVNPTREAGYFYKGVRTIPQVQKVISAFIKRYREQYAGSEDAPKVLIAVDSLDMLMTETEEENYGKGVTKGDQGQRNKQLKAMLRTFVHDIKDLDIAMMVSSQVYKNQDVLNGEGVWIVSDAVRYSLSQILMVTKLKLKDKATGNFEGIKLRAQGFKTRFTKPFQTVELEVPYDKGIDPASGLLEVAVAFGVLEKRGSRVGFVGEAESWYAKDFDQHVERTLAAVVAADTGILNIADSEEETEEGGPSAKQRRLAAAEANQTEEDA